MIGLAILRMFGATEDWSVQSTRQLDPFEQPGTWRTGASPLIVPIRPYPVAETTFRASFSIAEYPASVPGESPDPRCCGPDPVPRLPSGREGLRRIGAI